MTELGQIRFQNAIDCLIGQLAKIVECEHVLPVVALYPC